MSLIIFVYYFLYILTLSHRCIFRPWQWKASPPVGFRWYCAGGSWKDGSGADLMLWSSRLAGFGPLGAQGTMTASLHEWSHGGRVTQRAYCVTGHTPPQTLWEENRTLLLLLICNVSLRWNSCSSWFWRQYLNCKWHFRGMQKAKVIP